MTEQEQKTARPSLGPRLLALAELCGSGRLIIDVGCDHALLPVHLLQEDRFDAALAIDLNQGPIDLARDRLRAELAAGELRSDLPDRLTFKMQDGLSGVDLLPGTCVVIAGIGGLETHKILEQVRHQTLAGVRFVLAPQRSYAELSYYLLSRGLQFVQRLVSQEAFTYLLMQAEGPAGEDRHAGLPAGRVLQTIYGFEADPAGLSAEEYRAFVHRQRRQLVYDLRQAYKGGRQRDPERPVYPAKSVLYRYLRRPEVLEAAIQGGYTNEDLGHTQSD